jgi:hypothetical protein
MYNVPGNGVVADAVSLLILLLPLILKLCGIGAKRVWMKNPATGKLEKGFFGFSWTYLYFGWWVPLIRGETAIAFLHLLATILTVGIWQLVVSFLYNRQYTGRLIEKGFKFCDEVPINLRAAHALGVDLDMHRSQIAARG